MIPNLRKLWNQFDEPPTVYALLNAYVNFGKTEKTKIENLASEGRGMFFDFTYPLASGWNKADFETMILNHFLMRRIGYETVTAFKIALNVKLNEIMPEYNRLYLSITNWNLFNDGESITRDATDNKSGTSNVQNSQTSTSNGTDTASGTSDHRYSDTPQNQLSDVQNGSYVSEYNYDQNTNSATSTNSSTTNATGTNTTSDSSAQHEVITRTPADKVRLYSEFLTARQNLYTMIFKDLDSLFYQLV